MGFGCLVYLTGIPKDATEQEVTDLVGSFGKINNVILMPSSEEEGEKDEGQKVIFMCDIMVIGDLERNELLRELYRVVFCSFSNYVNITEKALTYQQNKCIFILATSSGCAHFLTWSRSPVAGICLHDDC